MTFAWNGDMKSLVDELQSGRWSCVVGNGSEMRTFTRWGVADLYNILTKEPELLVHSFIADKVVGKGAAALMILGKVSRLHTHIISTPALALLRDAGVATDFDQEVLDELAREDRGPMAMATILSSQGSVPRGAGAKMLITPWGTTVGSIGGGCAEAGVIREALDLIGTGGWKIYQLDLTGSAEDEGMVCGGIMEVLLEDVPQ